MVKFSETWLNSSNTEVHILGYNIYRIDRKHKRGGSLCIYLRNDFKSKILKDLSFISIKGLHQLWVQIQVNKNRSMIVCTSYRPPDCPDSSVRDDLKPKFIEASLMGKDIIISDDPQLNQLRSQSTTAYMFGIIPDSTYKRFCPLRRLKEVEFVTWE